MGAIGRNLILRNYPGICVNVLRIPGKKKKKRFSRNSMFRPRFEARISRIQDRNFTLNQTVRFSTRFLSLPLSLSLSVCLSVYLRDADEESRLRGYYGVSTFIMDGSVTPFRTKWRVAGVAHTSDVRVLIIFLLRLEEITSYDVGMFCSGIIEQIKLYECW